MHYYSLGICIILMGFFIFYTVDWNDISGRIETIVKHVATFVEFISLARPNIKYSEQLLLLTYHPVYLFVCEQVQRIQGWISQKVAEIIQIISTASVGFIE
jgi:hypothetical protein